MNDFEYDCLEKKRLARQVQYRKRGSKSRKCSLPSDHMTAKQWKERNGAIMSVKLNAPMTWDTFITLSPTLQSTYIKTMVEKYNANATSLGAMFGVKGQTVIRYISKHDLGVVFQVGHSMTKPQRELWEKFLSDERVEETPTIAAVPDAPPDKPADAPAAASPFSAPMYMSDFSVTFHGRIDADHIANSLLRVLGSNAVGTVQITCRLGDIAACK